MLSNFATCLKVAYGLSKPMHALWRNIVYKLSGKKRSLRISETAGVFCSEPHSQDKTCAWPSRFASWLRLQFPAIPIYLDNQATGGTSTAGSLPLITHWPMSDLILVDYIVNDVFDTVGSIIPAYESFIRQLSKSRPGVPVISVITCPLEIFSKVRDVIMWTTSLYDIPVISFYCISPNPYGGIIYIIILFPIRAWAGTVPTARTRVGKIIGNKTSQQNPTSWCRRQVYTGEPYVRMPQQPDIQGI